MSNWEETLGQTQKVQQRLHILTNLGIQDSSGGPGGYGLRKHQSYPPHPATAATLSQRSSRLWMGGSLTINQLTLMPLKVLKCLKSSYKRDCFFPCNDLLVYIQINEEQSKQYNVQNLFCFFNLICFTKHSWTWNVSQKITSFLTNSAPLYFQNFFLHLNKEMISPTHNMLFQYCS